MSSAAALAPGYPERVSTWKLTLEYDGTKYRGWQEQKNARGILGELRRAAEDLFGEPVELQGAGRTDAGVHALAQVAHLRVRKPVRQPAETLRRALNDRLPADIVILEVEAAPPQFHARHDAASRSYLYQIATRKSAFAKKYVWWVKEDLNVERMQRAVRMLIGRHDFACFRAADPGRPDESTIVVVTAAELFTAEDAPETLPTPRLTPGSRKDGLIYFRIEASHFVWKMVRRVVGALVQVGMGRLSLDEFEELLEGHPVAGLPVAEWTAPASGLFLEEVRYPEVLPPAKPAAHGTRKPIPARGPSGRPTYRPGRPVRPRR